MRALWLAKLINRLLRRVRQRAPDLVIGGHENPYMLRWFVIPRNRIFNIYHHEVRRSDDDRALHDHPWWSLSIALDGDMLEVLPGGVLRELRAGDIVLRRAASAHRLVLRQDGFCSTLFITGPKIRVWGYHCPQGWKHHEAFTKPGNTAEPGPGCDP